MDDVLLQEELARELPWLAFYEAVRYRREMRREFRQAVEALPPGAIEKLWDDDKIELGLALEALRWRHHKGLEP